MIDAVGDRRLEAGRGPAGVERQLVGSAIDAGGVALVEDDLVVANLAPDADRVGR